MTPEQIDKVAELRRSGYGTVPYEPSTTQTFGGPVRLLSPDGDLVEVLADGSCRPVYPPEGQTTSA